MRVAQGLDRGWRWRDGGYKSLAEIFISGHGSPFVAQISLAHAGNFYKAVLDGIQYRGTSFLQCFTACQPEHGVADDMATRQASRVRDSRCMPDFVFDPRGGETYEDTLTLKGNPNIKSDWAQVKSKRGGKYSYTIAHWVATEARFRRHLRKLGDTESLEPLEDILLRITQDDITHRRFLIEGHHAYVPDFGTFIEVEDDEGQVRSLACSRQLVLFCVERRRAWRMLQSRARVRNLEYVAQRAMLARLNSGELAQVEFLARTRAIFEEELERLAEPQSARSEPSAKEKVTAT